MVSQDDSGQSCACETAAEWVAVDALKQWRHNPRKNDKVVRLVAASIKRFGFGAPILARRVDGEIIAGHTRIKAAQLLGLVRVPVRYLELDPADAHLLALADNKLTELADWDDDALRDVVSGYSPDDLLFAGWDAHELDALLDSEPLFTPTDGDEQPRLDRSGWVTCPKCGHEFKR